ncbi:MAG: hypothetical protein GC162_04340 [Planctomycetes bacterium]|nr:hypothetical protein [Planctomycetota bacterium]
MMKGTPKKRVMRHGAMMLGLSVAWAASARAATFTWNVTGSSNWATGTNWVGNTAPGLTGTDTILQFTRAASNYTAQNTVGAGTTDVFHLVGLEFTNTGTGTSTYTVSRANSRTLSFDAGSPSGSPYIALDANGGTFNFNIPAALTANLAIKGNGTATFTFNSGISGNFGITKTGTSLVDFSAASTYTGLTTITGGTIKITAANAIASGNSMSIGAAGTLDMNSRDVSLDQLSGSGSISTTSGALTVGSANSSNTWSGVISGGGDLVKAGNGTFTLATSQTYTGKTTVNGGTLFLNSGVSLSSSTDLTVNSPGFLDANSNNLTVASLAGSGNISMGTGTLSVVGGSTYSGVISGSGGFNKTGSGALTMSGANNFTGPINVTGGTLRLSGAANRFLTTVDVNVTGGTFDLNTNSQTIDALTGSGTVLTSSSATTLTLGNDNGSGVFSGAINESGNVTKIGSGTQTLSGTGSTYSGNTNINGGVLSVTTIKNNGTASSLGNANNSGATITFNGGTLQYTGATDATNRGFTVNTGGATIDIANAGTTLTFSGAAIVGSGSGGFAKSGAGTLILSNTNTYTGNTTVKLGLLNITGSLANNGSSKVFIDADGNGDFASGTDTKLSRAVAAAASYTGYGSAITSSALTKADLLGGSNTTLAVKSLGMQWRTVASTVGEINRGNLASDVINLTGIDTTKFVLQMNYAPIANEAVLAAAQQIRLAWLDTNTNTWKNAILGNHGANVGLTNVQGSWAGAGGSTLVLGSWGVDTTNHVVWAVLDHNSQFAVLVPSPMALPAGLTLLSLLAARRRR